MRRAEPRRPPYGSTAEVHFSAEIRPMTLVLLALACFQSPVLLPSPPPVRTERPSVLLVVLDDVGVNMIPSYGIHPYPPCLPNLDALAAAGVRFTGCYINPTCSVARASLLTGRYSFRTGVGSAVQAGDPLRGWGLQLGERTLAEHLGAHGYSTWAAGKWHLSGDGAGLRDPNDQGFQDYRGNLLGEPSPSYFDWLRTVNGRSVRVTEYATTRTTIDALQMAAEAEGPWFGYVPFNAPHDPFHDPAAGTCGPGSCSCGTPGMDDTERYKASLESLDAHLGVLISGLNELTGGNLWIFVVGDNGTPATIDAPACPRGAKASLHEGGTRVPLIVCGPDALEGAVSTALVSGVDFFATISRIAGVPEPASAADSISFLPDLLGTGTTARTWAYCERFLPHGLPFSPTEQHQRSVQTSGWKLIRRDGTTPGGPAEELYDLGKDPCELHDIAPPFNRVQQAAYDELAEVLDDVLGVG